MIEADTADDGQEGFAYIRRIETPSQADFDDGKIDAPAQEVQKAQGGADLEEGQLFHERRRRHGADFAQQSRNFVFGNRLPIDLDTLLDGDEVGRGEQSDAITFVL